jgi:hypothetical protein
MLEHFLKFLIYVATVAWCLTIFGFPQLLPIAVLFPGIVGIYGLVSRIREDRRNCA